MKKLYILIILSLLIVSCQSQKQVEVKQNYKSVKLSSIGNDTNTKLSDIETEQIKLLAETIAFGKDNFISGMEYEDTVFNSEEEQALFLFNLNIMSDEDVAKRTLNKVVDFTSDGMKLNERSAKEIIQSAGGEVADTRLWSYILNETRADASIIYVKEVGNEFVFPILSKSNLENYGEYKNWEFIKGGNDTLTVKFREYLEPEDIYVHDLELELYKNNESIFAGYSAKKITRKLALPDDVKSNSNLSNLTYTAPDGLSKDMKDYTFKLEENNYRLPVPVKAFTDDGWELNLTDIPQKGNKKTAELVKNSKKIPVTVCNYTGEENKESLYVVWFKINNTEKEKIEFELSGGIKNGDKKIEDKKYYFLDGLYNDEFGIKITFDNNDLVNGFEMSYAPDNIDRTERINMLSTDQSGKEIRLEPDIKYEKLERGKIYLIPASNNEIIKLEIKYLDRVDWGKYTLCLIKNGEELGIYDSTCGRFIEYPEITLNKDDNGDVYVLINGVDSRNNEGEEKIYITRHR